MTISSVTARLLAILALLTLYAPSAFAHATPMVYVPNASSLLAKAPDQIRIQFSEHIEPKASGITVFAPDGSRADANNSSLDAADGRVLTVGLHGAGEGTYTVSWQVVSQDDGHFTKGGFSFSVGNKSSAAAASGNSIRVENSSTFSQAGTIGIELLGQSMLLGVLAFIALFWRSQVQSKVARAQQNACRRSSTLVVMLGVVLIVAGVLSFLFLKTIDLQQSRASGFAETFQTFLSTVDGRFAMYRAIVGIVFAAVYYVTRKKSFERKSFSASEAILLALLVLMVLIRARVSHAAASHFMPNLSILMNAVHLLAKEFWVGGLIVLTVVLMPILSKLGRASMTASILTAMSKYLSIALGVTGVTGAYIIWLHLKSPANIFTSQWGTRFVVLSAFAGVLVLIRLYHQLVAEPCVVAASNTPQKGYRKEVVSGLQYSILFEMCVGVVVLFVTSYLIITTPPYAPDHFTFEKRANSSGAQIVLALHPYDEKQFLLTVSDEKTGEPIPISEAVITLENVEKNIGPVVAETEPRFSGGFTFPRESLSLPGKWSIEITARRPETYDVVASFMVDFPTELDASRVSGDARHFGTFEAMMAFVVLGSIAVPLLLHRFSAKLHLVSTGSEQGRGVNAPAFGVFRAILVAVPSTLLLCLAVWFSYDIFVKTDFEKLCEENKGTWTLAAPMRAGLTLSPNGVTGCTTPLGDSHFADMREYAYSLDKPNPVDHSHHHK